jgi:hypothetical protein
MTAEKTSSRSISGGSVPRFRPGAAAGVRRRRRAGGREERHRRPFVCRPNADAASLLLLAAAYWHVFSVRFDRRSAHLQTGAALARPCTEACWDVLKF